MRKALKLQRIAVAISVQTSGSVSLPRRVNLVDLFSWQRKSSTQIPLIHEIVTKTIHVVTSFRTHEYASLCPCSILLQHKAEATRKQERTGECYYRRTNRKLVDHGRSTCCTTQKRPIYTKVHPLTLRAFYSLHHTRVRVLQQRTSIPTLFRCP